jgi:hypothetical protein
VAASPGVFSAADTQYIYINPHRKPIDDLDVIHPMDEI